MKRPSNQYLYGFTGSYGANLNVTAEDYARVDRAMAAERRALRRDRGIVDVAVAVVLVTSAELDAWDAELAAAPVDRPEESR